MKKLIIALFILPFLLLSVHATEIEIPEVPADAQAYMPYENETFLDGLMYILTHAISNLMPDFTEGLKVGLLMFAAALSTSCLSGMNGSVKKVSELIATLLTATILLTNTHSLIGLGVETIEHLNAYSKLLLPAMTTILASSGGVTTSAALYAGTAFFSAILTSVINSFFVPLLYVFIAICIANRALGENVLSSFKQFIKWLMTWLLKIILYVFTGYMTITGVVSGSADALTLKATKITISGMVPVVGGIISDASEAILVGAGIMKGTAGIYGIFAFLSICISPILKIIVHCTILKITAALCSIFGPKGQCGLVEDFSQAMSMILAATAALCLLLLISSVAFMKGVH